MIVGGLLCFGTSCLVLLCFQPHLMNCFVGEVGHVVWEEELTPAYSEQHNSVGRVGCGSCLESNGFECYLRVLSRRGCSIGGNSDSAHIRGNVTRKDALDNYPFVSVLCRQVP